MEFSQPVCTITAGNKDLVEARTRIFPYGSLVSHLSHGLGVCLLADSGTIAGKYSTQLRDAIVC